jgi:eukaryotic-like serine/threonine-protein kinase
MQGAIADLEMERVVRERLYGGREGLIVRPLRSRPRGRLVGGRYRLLERLGSGATATVHRARDERLERAVAVKLIDERLAHDVPSVQRFRREAELGARLGHPNVVGVLDAGTEPRAFLVMELVDGIDCGTLMSRHGQLSARETVHIVAQACEALAHVHEQNVVHDDVSARNILVRLRDGTAKVGDFGLAHDVREPGARAVGGLAGTPGYVAPEVLRGAAPSPRSDLYGLGVVAYRLLTGGRPAWRDDPDATGPLPTAAPRLPPLEQARPDVPSALADAVGQALADDPAARQRSVTELGDQLAGPRSARLRLLRSAA